MGGGETKVQYLGIYFTQSLANVFQYTVIFPNCLPILNAIVGFGDNSLAHGLVKTAF